MPFWLKIDHSWPLLLWAWAAPELIRSSTRAAMSNCRSAGARGGGGGQWGWSNPSGRQPAPPNPSRPNAAQNPYDACRGSWSPLRRLQIWKVNRSLSSTSMMMHGIPVPDMAGIGDHGQRGELNQCAHQEGSGHATQLRVPCCALRQLHVRSDQSRGRHLDRSHYRQHMCRVG